jgi:integrase
VAPTRHRPHKPHEQGPRIEKRGRWQTADLRPWGGSRYTALRDPRDPSWPDAGERTEDRDTAAEWAWKYVALYRDDTRDRHQGRQKARRVTQALIDEYQAHRSRTTAARTPITQQAALHALLDRFRDRPTHSIRAKDLQAMLDELHAQGYARNTLKSNAASWRSFFGWLGGANPAAKLDIPADASPDEPYAWTDEDIQAVRKHAETEPINIRLLIEIGLGTGCRLGEALALRWDDFDPASKTVRITRQHTSGTTRIQQLKGKQSRTALVLPFFWPHYTPTDGLCMAAEGRPLTSGRVYAPTVRCLQAAGVHGPQRGFHDARRTYGRLFLEMGGWMDELQRSLGHSSIRQTEAAYGQFQAAVAAQFARARIYGEGRARRLL